MSRKIITEIIQYVERRPRRKRTDRLKEVLAQFPSDQEPRIHLYRIDEKGRRRYLTSYPLACFSLVDVAQDFGGGTYWFRAKSRGRRLRTGVFEIDGDPISPQPAESLIHHSQLSEILSRLERIEEQVRRRKKERDALDRMLAQRIARNLDL